MPCSLFVSPCSRIIGTGGKTGEERTKRNRTGKSRSSSPCSRTPAFLPVTLEFNVHVDAQRSWTPPPHIALSSSRAQHAVRPRLELGTASASAPVCCVCVCVRVLCLRMRLRLHLDYTCGACSLHSATATAAPLSCPGGVLSVCLSAGPPCPPRRCISVPSLRVGYSTD